MAAVTAAQPQKAVRENAAFEKGIGLALQFQPQPPIDPARIIQLIQTRRGFKLSGQDRLRVEEKHPETPARAQRVREILRELAKPVEATKAAVR